MRCSIEGCEKPSRKRGWCEMHYSRFKAHGTPHAPGRQTLAEHCCVDGCGRSPIAKAMCRRHYYAARRAAERATRPPSPPKPLCDVSDCEEYSTARGWCGAHYQRWRRFGDPTFTPPSRPRSCRVADCDGAVNARELCGRHYYRWQRYGDPQVSKNRPRKTEPARRFAARVCPTCGSSFDPGNSPSRKYCGRRCRPTRSSVGVNKRPTVIRLARDHGWMCRLCDLPIDPALFWPEPGCGSVDHILSVTHGGTDDYANLQLTHLRCNLLKGVG